MSKPLFGTMFAHGRSLTAQEFALYTPYFTQAVLQQARIVDGHVPYWLKRNMCAVVLHQTIYFRAGAYQPNTRHGAALLGHELMHVAQFLHGMTLLNYLWSCRNGYRNSPYETQAYAMGEIIAKNYPT